MADRRPLNYPRFRAFNGNGVPLEGGTVEFFEAGSTNNRTVYSDPDLTVAAPNPVTLNARGEPESGGGTPIDIYVDGNPYKIVLKDSDGNTVWTIDNYTHDGGDSTVQFVALDLGDDGNDESSGLNRISISNDTNSIATESVADELNFDMSQNWPTADDVPDSAVDHDQTTNFVANEHIDHSGVNITAGTGLSGGGDITATRTLNFDIPSLTSVTAASGDSIAVADDSDSNNTKRVTAQSIADLGAAGSSTEDPNDATDSGTDTFEVSFGTDVSAGEIAKADFQSANTTTTPTLENTGGTPSGALTITTKDGSALWAGALSGVHTLQLASDGNSWLVLGPNPSDQRDFTRAASTTQKGDVELATDAETESGTDNERAVTPAGLASLGGLGALVPLVQNTASSDASLDFTSNIDSTYDAYLFVVSGIRPDTASTFEMRTSTVGGTSYDNSDYEYILKRLQSNDAEDRIRSGSASSIAMTGPGVGTQSSNSVEGVVLLPNPVDGSKHTQALIDLMYQTNTDVAIRITGMGDRAAAESVDAVRFRFGSGNIAEGSIRMYGVKKS